MPQRCPWPKWPFLSFLGDPAAKAGPCRTFSKLRLFRHSVLAGALLLAALPAGAAERVALQLKWLHAYQFAGYYAAEAQGYYREAGLEVEIREGRPGMDFVGEVVSGRAQYGTGSSALVLDRNQGLPVVALAVIFQHSPDILMVPAGSGITTPQQLVFKRVMTNYSTPAIVAMLLNEAGPLNKFAILDQTNDLQGLIEGRLDAVAGYQTDQPFFFKERGFPINVLRPVQYGVDFYGDNLFTREEELRRHPQRAEAFRAASLKGWDYAMSHPEEMIPLIQRLGSRLSAEHLRHEYQAMRPLVLQDLVEPGHMNPGRWKHIADTYVRLGQLKPGYTLDGFLYDPDPSHGLERYRTYFDAVSGMALLAALATALLYRFNRRLRAEVSERQRAEQRLTEAQRIARIGSWELDLVAGAGVWSDEEYRLLGYEPGSVAPSVDGFLRRVHPEDRAKIGEAVDSARRSMDGGYRMEYRVLRDDGSVRFMDERGRILFGEAGEVLHAIGTTLDVTERKRIELALREQEAYLRTIIDHDPQCIKLLDRNGALLDMNPTGLAIIEADSLEQVRGRPVYALVAAKDRAAFRGMVEAVFRGEPCRLIFEVIGLKGTRRQLETQSVPLWDSERRAVRALLGVTEDVGERLKAEAQLEHLAHHDALTGLPNRLLLTARLEHVLQQAERHPAQGAVLFLDLDRFKHVNDSLGHDIGDELLRRVCGRLRQAVRREDTVARLGGDEFTVLLEDLKDTDDAARLADKLIQALAAPFEFEARRLFIGVSIGISVYPQDGRTVGQLLRNADAAMYRAKEEGRNTYRFYTEEMTAQALEHIDLQSQLRHAIESGQLSLHYQPQVDLADGRLVGMEALARWAHPAQGMIPPDRFIPMAEDTGLILPLGEWALRTACFQGRVWLDKGLDFGRLSVNVAGQQLQRGDLLGVVKRALADARLPPARLELEITESFVMKEAERAIGLLRAIRELGVNLAIDDFGTGYSSLAYLKRLPFDKLKIDKGFVRDLAHDENDAAISRAVIALGHSLQFTVIAEGVETDAQRARLLGDGCDQAQGYLYGKPMPSQQSEAYLRGFSSPERVAL